MKRLILLACLLFPASTSQRAEPPSPIERYRNLEFPEEVYQKISHFYENGERNLIDR